MCSLGEHCLFKMMFVVAPTAWDQVIDFDCVAGTQNWFWCKLMGVLNRNKRVLQHLWAWSRWQVCKIRWIWKGQNCPPFKLAASACTSLDVQTELVVVSTMLSGLLHTEFQKACAVIFSDKLDVLNRFSSKSWRYMTGWRSLSFCKQMMTTMACNCLQISQEAVRAGIL